VGAKLADASLGDHRPASTHAAAMRDASFASLATHVGEALAPPVLTGSDAACALRLLQRFAVAMAAPSSALSHYRLRPRLRRGKRIRPCLRRPLRPLRAISTSCVCHVALRDVPDATLVRAPCVYVLCGPQELPPPPTSTTPTSSTATSCHDILLLKGARHPRGCVLQSRCGAVR
jgi:hypothetical protein